MTKMKAPEGVGSHASFAGEEVVLDADRCIRLSGGDAVAAAKDHGFTVVSEQVEEAQKAEEEATAKKAEEEAAAKKAEEEATAKKAEEEAAAVAAEAEAAATAAAAGEEDEAAEVLRRRGNGNKSKGR